MAKTRNKQFEFLVWGYQANELAGKVELLKVELAKVKGKLNAFLKRNRRMTDVERSKITLAVFATIAWGLITAVEYGISKEIYAVVANTMENSWEPIVMALGLAFTATIFSACIAESFNPEMTRGYERTYEEAVGATILGQNKAPFNRRPVIVAAGFVGAVVVGAGLYALSCERVALEKTAGLITDESMTQILLPPVLFGMEVIAGVYLPFMVSYLLFRAGNKKLHTQITVRERERESLEGRVHRLREAHDRDVERYNRQHPEDAIEAVAPSIALLKVLRARLGKDAVGEIPEEIPDDTPTEVSHTAEADPVPTLDAVPAGHIEAIPDGARNSGNNDSGDDGSQAFLQEFEQRLKQSEIEP